MRSIKIFILYYLKLYFSWIPALVFHGSILVSQSFHRHTIGQHFFIKCNFIFAILAILSCTTSAQEILPESPSRFLTKFPFKQYSGGVIVIEARVGNIPDTLHFILDTGSGGISLDSTTTAEFNLPQKQTDTVITGLGGVRKVPFVFNQTLHLPGLSVERLNFHVNNYEVLSSVYGERIDGIIGYSFFSKFIVKINFDSTDVEVYTPGKMVYPERGTMLHPIFTAIPILWTHIKDRRKMDFNFYFDTGAGLCFLMSDVFAKDSSILLSRRKPVITQAEGMGGRLQMRLTVVKEVKIGPYKFRNVPTYLYKDEYNVTAYPYVGGLIGNDLLRRFNLILNYPKREIHLLPNSHYTDRFDYAYTGMAIYVIDNKILIEDIIVGSPADKAGCKVGDEIIAVDKNFSYDIQQYKAILQTPDERIHLIVKRNEKLVLLVIKPKSIL